MTATINLPRKKLKILEWSSLGEVLYNGTNRHSEEFSPHRETVWQFSLSDPVALNTWILTWILPSKLKIWNVIIHCD